MDRSRNVPGEGGLPEWQQAERLKKEWLLKAPMSAVSLSLSEAGFDPDEALSPEIKRAIADNRKRVQQIRARRSAGPGKAVFVCLTLLTAVICLNARNVALPLSLFLCAAALGGWASYALLKNRRYASVGVCYKLIAVLLMTSFSGGYLLFTHPEKFNSAMSAMEAYPLDMRGDLDSTASSDPVRWHSPAAPASPHTEKRSTGSPAKSAVASASGDKSKATPDPDALPLMLPHVNPGEHVKAAVQPEPKEQQGEPTNIELVKATTIPPEPEDVMPGLKEIGAGRDFIVLVDHSPAWNGPPQRNFFQGCQIVDPFVMKWGYLRSLKENQRQPGKSPTAPAGKSPQLTQPVVQLNSQPGDDGEPNHPSDSRPVFAPERSDTPDDPAERSGPWQGRVVVRQEEIKAPSFEPPKAEFIAAHMGGFKRDFYN